MREIVLLVHDIRSTHNVGSLLRTAEGLGIAHVYFSGYTPFPQLATDDPRLPHLAAKIDAQIHKTALDAEKLVPWSVDNNVSERIRQLRADGYTVLALEQAPNSVKLPDYQPPQKVAVLLGREVEGIEPELLQLCDTTLEIPMFGQKESFNVVQAAAMTLYHLRFAEAEDQYTINNRTAHMRVSPSPHSGHSGL
ncbi:TrmH family RNA methyltransferase [Candidatus Saccharibacteria bacterium]|nr:MAG: TrmH family RNA methyltransferase [Candidatus Saccharibacteria bacterium]